MKSGLTIYAKDFKKLASFYSKVFAIRSVESNDEFILLQTVGFEMVILQSPASLVEKIVITDPPTPRENTAIKPIFFVDSIRDTRNSAILEGGFMKSRDKEWQFLSHLVCDGFDCEGNIFQVREKISEKPTDQ